MPTPSLLIVPARFKSGKLYSQVPTSGTGDFTVTRATSATRVNASGLIESVASGIPRLDYFASGGVVGCPALLVEPSAQNLVLHSRDLTNAVWSGSNVTTAKNAVGADGVASGATTLTATAASGTVLQALSHASQSRIFSAYVRRVSGSGAIQMTTNGGTNWTTVTISSLYTQVACAAQTVASGTVGFRMAVSGDVIEVDFTQGEVGPVFTSPIPTTTAAVTRNADVVSVSGAVSGAIGQTVGTIYCEFAYFGRPSVQSGPIFLRETSLRGLSIGTAGVTNINFTSRNAAGSTSLAIVTGSVQLNTYYKVAIAYDANGTAAGGSEASGVVAYVNGVQTNIGTFRVPDGVLSEFRMYGAPAASADNDPFNGRIRAAALYTTRLTNAQLAALTTP